MTKNNRETYPWPGGGRSAVIAITGATGLVGSALRATLRSAGHEVRGISRGATGEIRWNPDQGEIDAAGLEGVDGIVHLAGEPIAQRWTREARARILESRTKGTRLLAETVSRLKRPPRSFVSISGIHAYGSVRAEPVDEESRRGSGFLADVCRAWEEATAPVDAAGIRKVIVRSSMVLSANGGALAAMLPFFRAGIGGPIGQGKRWMSWIEMDDLVRVLAEALFDDRYRGILNASAPGAVRNREFSQILGDCLHRPAKIPIPPVMLKLTLGRMAEETLLSDLRVRPTRLVRSGFQFRFPELKEALEQCLQSAKEVA